MLNLVQAINQGLMQALELVQDRETKVPDPKRAQLFLELSREEGLLIGLGGTFGQVVRMGPSMLVDASQIDDALARVERVCERLERAA